MGRVSWFVAATIVLAAFSTPAMAETPGDTAKIAAIIARTKLTQTTYAAYFWNRIERAGQAPVEEWSAEFNAGPRHRVETPRDRVVADCAAQSGSAWSIARGDLIVGAGVAAAACGINTNVAFLKVEYLGRVESRFGQADRVRVTDANTIRTYDVADSGILLRTVYQTNSPQPQTLLVCEAVAVFDRLPDAAMFDDSFLLKSFVPERFKLAPQ